MVQGKNQKAVLTFLEQEKKASVEVLQNFYTQKNLAKQALKQLEVFGFIKKIDHDIWGITKLGLEEVERMNKYENESNKNK